MMGRPKTDRRRKTGDARAVVGGRWSRAGAKRAAERGVEGEEGGEQPTRRSAESSTSNIRRPTSRGRGGMTNDEGPKYPRKRGRQRTSNSQHRTFDVQRPREEGMTNGEGPKCPEKRGRWETEESRPKTEEGDYWTVGLWDDGITGLGATDGADGRRDARGQRRFRAPYGGSAVRDQPLVREPRASVRSAITPLPTHRSSAPPRGAATCRRLRSATSTRSLPLRPSISCSSSPDSRSMGLASGRLRTSGDPARPQGPTETDGARTTAIQHGAGSQGRSGRRVCHPLVHATHSGPRPTDRAPRAVSWADQ